MEIIFRSKSVLSCDLICILPEMYFLIYVLIFIIPARTLARDPSLALEVFYHDCDRYDNDELGIEVCGDDGITYRNPVFLSCLNYKKNKKPAVKIMSFGSCPGTEDKSGCPWSPFYAPVCGSDGQTYVNEERLMCVANQTGEEISVEKKGECTNEEDLCDIDEDISPGPKVCGSNGLTYPSARVVRCLSRLRADIDIEHEGGCTVEDVEKLYQTRKKFCSISKHHYEFNPVCGANNISYLNPFVFLCFSPLTNAVFSGGQCNSPVHESCVKAINLDRQYEECRKEIDLEEVCGADGLTYRSKDHLMCASRNNTMLTELHEGRCKQEDSPCIRARTNHGFPTCGSDGVTYSSPLAMYCIARSRDRDVKFVHTGPCIQLNSRLLNFRLMDGGDS